MWRAGVTTIDSKTFAENFNTKDEADLWVLEQAETVGIKKSIVVNKEETKERYIINWTKEEQE